MTNARGLGNTIVEVALTHVGVKETSRNRGPLIDEWISRMGLRPEDEHAWCAAFAWCMVDDGCKLYGCLNPIRPSAKVARLYQRAAALGYVSKTPVIGAIACHVVDPNDPLSAGHCGIVKDIAGDHNVHVEGNTNGLGSREGDQVAKQIRRHGWVNLGYVVVPIC